MVMNSYHRLITTQVLSGVLPFISWRNNQTRVLLYRNAMTLIQTRNTFLYQAHCGFEKSRVDIARAITLDSSIYSL